MLNGIRNKLHQIKNKKIIIGVIIVLAIGYFFLKPKPQTPIATEAVVRKDIIQSISGTGNVNSTTIANLNFLASGKLVSLGAHKGDTVTKGELIAAQDQRTVQKNLETALRNYSEQRNTYDQTTDNNQNNILNTSLQRVLKNNQYDLEKAVISVELQSLAKEQSELISPISGVLIRSDDEITNTNVTPSTTYTVADLHHLVFQVDIDEADIGKVHLGQSMKINLDAFPDENISVPIIKIDFASHTTSTGGTAYTVEANFDGNSLDKYRIGMSGNADIILAQRNNVLSIPISSLGDNNTVYVLRNKKFIQQKVQIGLQNDTDVEIKNGLQSGDKVASQPSDVK